MTAAIDRLYLGIFCVLKYLRFFARYQQQRLSLVLSLPFGSFIIGIVNPDFI